MSSSSGAEARKPVQERSRLRFEALLDAAAQLLAERDMRAIGIYDIASLAGVPAASAYHFFPTPDAAFIELARRHLGRLRAEVDRPLDEAELARIRNWPDLIVLRFDRVVRYYNSDPVIGRLFLSGTVISEIRTIDVEHTDFAASLVYDWLDGYVVMPRLPAAGIKFTTMLGIFDGVWMTSYARHGTLTEPYCEEAQAAAIAYCRTFLPEVLPLRSLRAPSPVSQA